MDFQAKIQKELLQAFEAIKVRNPSFSIRAFANRLGIGSGALSQILNGRRKVSQKMAEQLLDRSLIPPDRKKKILGSPASQRDSVALDMDTCLLYTSPSPRD